MKIKYLNKSNQHTFRFIVQIINAIFNNNKYEQDKKKSILKIN